MLSIVDLKRELGRNIYIYPLHAESIKSNSIDLHVSRFAWSLSTHQSIGAEDYIRISPHDTALIYTEESIYVSNKIGGSYHSKVVLVSRGAGHIGTTLDAQYVGCSLIAVHNLSDKKLSLKVGSEFVTLMFWYLNSPDYKEIKSHDNEPGHPRMLQKYQGVESYIEWRDSNPWTTRAKDLYTKMVNSPEYAECQKTYHEELRKFNRGAFREGLIRFLNISIPLALIAVPVILIAYVYDLGAVSSVVSNLAKTVIYPVMVAVIASYVISGNHYSGK